jgi:2-polyprenyl-6-methoxyphenol hydroxylase-like FAD-dependent oxidoreductase
MLPESVLPHTIHHDLIDAMTFCLPRGEQFLGYPVAGPDNDLRPGRRRYNIIWYRPADEAGELPWLLTDGRGILHSISIPPPLIRGEAIAGMREAAERLVAPQCRALVQLIDEPLLQPIYDLASPRLAFGRVALVGDAAFVARARAFGTAQHSGSCSRRNGPCGFLHELLEDAGSFPAR